MHLAKSRVFFLLCRKYRYAIFPESRQKYLAKWRSVALIGERHVRIEISDFVMRTFVSRFHISSALKAANAYKQEGFPVIEIFRYLFLLIFSKVK